MPYPGGFRVTPMPMPTPYGGPDYSGGIREGFSNITSAIDQNRKYALGLQTEADQAAANQADLEIRRGALDVTRGTLDLERQKAATAALGGDEKWFGNSIPAVGPNGQPILIMQSDKGRTKELPMPAGYKPTGGRVHTMDLGSSYTLVDGFGNPVLDANNKPISWPKDIAGAAAAAKVGEAAGVKQAALPGVDEAVAEFDRSVDAVLTDPDLNQQIGPIEGRFPEALDLAGNRTRVRNNARKVMNNAFTIAYEKLKGAGPISEGEGKAATAAIAQLDNFTVPDKTYRGYLDEAKARVHAIADSQRRAASLQPNLPAPPPPPTYPSAPAAPAAPALNDPMNIR